MTEIVCSERCRPEDTGTGYCPIAKRFYAPDSICEVPASRRDALDGEVKKCQRK